MGAHYLAHYLDHDVTHYLARYLAQYLAHDLDQHLGHDMAQLVDVWATISGTMFLVNLPPWASHGSKSRFDVIYGLRILILDREKYSRGLEGPPKTQKSTKMSQKSTNMLGNLGSRNSPKDPDQRFSWNLSQMSPGSFFIHRGIIFGPPGPMFIYFWSQ